MHDETVYRADPPHNPNQSGPHSPARKALPAPLTDAEAARAVIGVARGGKPLDGATVNRLPPQWQEAHSVAVNGGPDSLGFWARTSAGRNERSAEVGTALASALADERGDATQARLNATDVGNAKRLVRTHGRHMRYAPNRGKWLVWDGRRWREDTTSMVVQLAMKTAFDISAEALAAADPTERSKLLKWSLDSESRKRIEAMIFLAQSLDGMSVMPDELDRDPMLLNARNGTIDLRTGTLRAHNPADLITKLADVDYDPTATCPRWEQFEREIMDSDDEMVYYLRRIGGYGITGDVREHCLFFFYGGGRNGKSLYLNTLQRVLGDYATVINANLITTKNQEEHPTGLTDLEGRRLVCTIEVEDGKKMAEALVKQLTGGDPIKARRMRQDFYQFLPSHKIILAANHQPEIRGTDEGVWKRVKLISFPVTFVEPSEVDLAKKKLLIDKTLEKALQAELPGILALMVRSCLEWQEGGLAEPRTVAETTAGYRAEMDDVGNFIEERCLVSPGLRAKFSVLYDAYATWAKASGLEVKKARNFGADMQRRGFAIQKSNSTAWRLGIAVRDEREDDPNDGPAF